MRTCTLLVAAALAARAAARPPPAVPGALPYFAATGAGSAAAFTVADSPRLHNRPLYGPHTGALVLTGDRPVAHLADDATIYGGLLFGVARGGVAVWAHDADNVTATYEGGAEAWVVSDARLPGLELRARIMPAAAGVGFVLDANVTDDGGGGGGAAELIYAYGCAAPAAPGSGTMGWAHDPLIHSDVLAWAFSPLDCRNNSVELARNGSTLVVRFGAAGARAVAVRLATSAANATLAVADAAGWANASALIAAAPPARVAPPPPRARAAALPLAGASLWLRASSLAAALPDGAPVAAWADEAGSGAALAQAAPGARPRLAHAGLGAGDAAVVFDGEATYLESPAFSVGVASTIFAVFRDDGSSGGDGCCSGVVFFGSPATGGPGGCNGIATLPTMAAADDDDGPGHAVSGHAVVTKLDYGGSDANGHLNIRGRPVVAASVYDPHGGSGGAALSTSLVDGCVQATRPIAGTPGAGVMLGSRGAELRRYFLGALAEVVVFPRALNETELAAMATYFAAAHPAVPPKARCEPTAGPLAVGRASLAPGATTRFTWSVTAAATADEPAAALAAAAARITALTRPVAETPDALIDAAVRAVGPAVDGLFRAQGVFVHGAAAWDVLYLGWRSQEGATALGWHDLVRAEGLYFFPHQDNTSSPAQPCKSDSAYLLTKETPGASRFYGRGKINENSGMYNMQTQFFDQQIHAWRWALCGTDPAYEAALRTALDLHAEWASASFDSDGNSLYASYINTWPTDSQWYNGAETVEETAYQYSVHLARRDLAARAGDAPAAAAADAAASKIFAAFTDGLWLQSAGHPAASREEGGHRRLRPDAWLYSIFLPIEAGLLTAEQAAQSLAWTETALQRDTVPCSANASAACGEVVWTSNWVPSQWSVRQLWAGDVLGLALAYFFAGLPDDGFNVLRGTLEWVMLQSTVPGQIGGTNGGTDFNDCVHPAARVLVEGLYGFRPNYANDTVLVAPQLPSAWPRATLATGDVTIAAEAGAPDGAAATLAVTLARPAARVVLRLPLHAAAMGAVAVTGAPAGATWATATEAGWGATIIAVTIEAAPGGAPIAGATVAVPFSAALPATASVAAAGTEGEPLTLAAPAGLTLTRFSDPQGVFAPGAAISVGGATLSGAVAAGAGAAGAHVVFGYATTAGGLPQALMFKVLVAAAAPPPPPPAVPAAGAAWAFLDVAPNADATHIYDPGTYLSPRPETCGVRIGTDGYSPWTGPYFHMTPPVPDFSNLANISAGNGTIVTPQGARFAFAGKSGAPNILFASQWDNYPATVAVAAPPGALPGATAAWALVAGSTNPMQTLLANAELRFVFDDGSNSTIALLPPLNFWSLGPWGVDYDIVADAFCMPDGAPPQVQLGKNFRAMVYAVAVPAGRGLARVELEVLSQEVVIGILAASLMRG